MKTKQILWLAFVAIFVLPSALYFIVNGYWWLFDGNHPIEDKMMAAASVVMTGAFVAGAWADFGNVWRK